MLPSTFWKRDGGVFAASHSLLNLRSRFAVGTAPSGWSVSLARLFAASSSYLWWAKGSEERRGSSLMAAEEDEEFEAAEERGSVVGGDMAGAIVVGETVAISMGFSFFPFLSLSFVLAIR